MEIPGDGERCLQHFKILLFLLNKFSSLGLCPGLPTQTDRGGGDAGCSAPGVPTGGSTNGYVKKEQIIYSTCSLCLFKQSNVIYMSYDIGVTINVFLFMCSGVRFVPVAGNFPLTQLGLWCRDGVSIICHK